jgi:hypothetical protein
MAKQVWEYHGALRRSERSALRPATAILGVHSPVGRDLAILGYLPDAILGCLPRRYFSFLGGLLDSTKSVTPASQL